MNSKQESFNWLDLSRLNPDDECIRDLENRIYCFSKAAISEILQGCVKVLVEQRLCAKNYANKRKRYLAANILDQLLHNQPQIIKALCLRFPVEWCISSDDQIIPRSKFPYEIDMADLLALHVLNYFDEIMSVTSADFITVKQDVGHIVDLWGATPDLLALHMSKYLYGNVFCEAVIGWQLVNTTLSQVVNCWGLLRVRVISDDAYLWVVGILLAYNMTVGEHNRSAAGQYAALSNKIKAANVDLLLANLWLYVLYMGDEEKRSWSSLNELAEDLIQPFNEIIKQTLPNVAEILVDGREVEKDEELFSLDRFKRIVQKIDRVQPGLIAGMLKRPLPSLSDADAIWDCLNLKLTWLYEGERKFPTITDLASDPSVKRNQLNHP